MHPEQQRLNEGLKRYIFKHEREGGGTNPRPLTQRNGALYESHFNLFRVQDPAVQELKAFCWNQLLWLIARLNGYDMATVNRLQIFNDSWFHITRRGGFFRRAQSRQRLMERRVLRRSGQRAMPTRRAAAS